jgi:hypothetical protein
MKYKKLLVLGFLMPWMPLAICQHLPAAPSFCAGELCIGSGPVVSDDVLNYPSFTFLKKINCKSTNISQNIETLAISS